MQVTNHHHIEDTRMPPDDSLAHAAMESYALSSIRELREMLNGAERLAGANQFRDAAQMIRRLEWQANEVANELER